MLRTLLIATILLTTSGTALAHRDDGYGRVVSVEPHFVISFGTRHHDGFRVMYESGGSRYWTHTPYRPGHTIVLPPRHRVHSIHHSRDHRWSKDHHRGLNGRHGEWHDDRHEGRRGDHREHRRDDRGHRRHDRD